MVVVKQGRIPEHKDYKVNCSYCDCLFQARVNEGAIRFDGPNGEPTHVVFYCPICTGGNRVKL